MKPEKQIAERYNIAGTTYSPVLNFYSVYVIIEETR